MQKVRRDRFSSIEGYLYILPATLLMLLLVVMPMFMTMGYSLTDWNGLNRINFIGFDNFRILFEDPAFWNSIKLTFLWVLLSVAFLPVTSMALAIMFEYIIPFPKVRPVARTILFMPQMLSLVAAALLWGLIYNPNLGLLVKLLSMAGVLPPNATLDLLGNYEWALIFTFIPVVWQQSGFGMVIYSAAMQGIPSELLEAGVIDGCTKSRMIRHIIIPLVKPTYALLATMNVIGAFKAFDLIYVLTVGGPGTATQVTALYIFKEAFVSNKYGFSTAASLILTIITVAFGLLFFRLSRRIEVYN